MFRHQHAFTAGKSADIYSAKQIFREISHRQDTFGVFVFPDTNLSLPGPARYLPDSAVLMNDRIENSKRAFEKRCPPELSWRTKAREADNPRHDQGAFSGSQFFGHP